MQNTNINDCIDIFNDYANLTDASRYFSAEELEKSKNCFICDLIGGFKTQYIQTIKEQIEEIKPLGLHGVYDFDLIRDYETILQRIIAF